MGWSRVVWLDWGWVGLGWAGLGWAGLGQVRLGLVRWIRASLGGLASPLVVARYRGAHLLHLAQWSLVRLGREVLRCPHYRAHSKAPSSRNAWRQLLETLGAPLRSEEAKVEAQLEASRLEP